ncbi:tellurite resistance TerB C-terminal domain-containing protein [Flavobacterium sp. FlaQc-47]|uniref:tellurite resistance TerB C-terminal domain-containing protein n=1 Tax=Flavobacterium sp. FlaQc-47 TaxID=3374180 RepID=UPI00375691AC
MDDSIIDVTGESYSLSNNLSRNSSVPYWGHQNVYSYSEINSASSQQRVFYKTYKFNFLNSIYTNLDGNNNYAFILLFDLLNEYDTHKNTIRLEKQLKELRVYHPKTKSYCVSNLVKKLLEHGLHKDVERIRKEENYYDDYAGYDYLKLGAQFRAKLDLSDQDVGLLNKLWNPENNFFSIEFCGLEVVKFYLYVIKKIEEKYEKQSSSLNKELDELADSIACKHYNYRKGSSNYKYSLETIVNELHSNIFKYCENVVRENFGHKRKLNVDLQYTSAEIIEEYNSRVILKLKKIMQIYLPTINEPDEKTDFELNIQNTTRWKIKFDQLTIQYKKDSKTFIQEIINLGNQNKNNPSVENIFYEGSKFIANNDKEAALTLYIYYIYYDLNSVKFDNKQLNTTVQKNLFKTSDQLNDFQIIINEFVDDKNLEKALKSIPRVYAAKRKKIQLDRNAIQEVHNKHSGTVELLNEYLRDEDEIPEVESPEVNEMVLQIIPQSQQPQTSPFDESINFSKIQEEILDLFSKANLSVLQADFEIVARSKGMFKNQLIESINEICYETLDDVLIEEDEEFYIINESYFNRILAK